MSHPLAAIGVVRVINSHDKTCLLVTCQVCLDVVSRHKAKARYASVTARTSAVRHMETHITTGGESACA